MNEEQIDNKILTYEEFTEAVDNLEEYFYINNISPVNALAIMTNVFLNIFINYSNEEKFSRKEVEQKLNSFFNSLKTKILEEKYGK